MRGFPGLTAITAIVLSASAVAAQSQRAGYLMLQDRLERQTDGYCLDLAGSGDWVDLSLPLAVYNCKGPAFYADQAVIFDQETGQIRFPAFPGACLTALGRQGRSLPGMPLLARACAKAGSPPPTPFDTAELQRFTHRGDGRIELTGSGLCLTVGDRWDTTFSPHDHWRALFLDECGQAPSDLSVWQKFTPRG